MKSPMSTSSASIFLLLVFSVGLVSSLNETAKTLIPLPNVITETVLDSNLSIVYFHRMILVDPDVKPEINSTFSFSFAKKTPSCDAQDPSKIKFSIGATKAGILEGEMTIQDMNNKTNVELSLDTTNTRILAFGNEKFALTIHSEGNAEIDAVGGDKYSSRTPIKYAFNFDSFNSTHYGIPFAAYYTEKGSGCDFQFSFDYDVLNEPIVIAAPAEKPTPSPVKPPQHGDSTDGPNTGASTTEVNNGEDKKPEDTNSGSVIVYVSVGIGSFLLGFIIAAVASFFLLPKIPFFKKRNSGSPSDGTAADVETTKMMPPSSANQDETNLESTKAAASQKKNKNKSGDKQT